MKVEQRNPHFSYHGHNLTTIAHGSGGINTTVALWKIDKVELTPPGVDGRLCLSQCPVQQVHHHIRVRPHVLAGLRRVSINQAESLTQSVELDQASQEGTGASYLFGHSLGPLGNRAGRLFAFDKGCERQIYFGLPASQALAEISFQITHEQRDLPFVE